MPLYSGSVTIIKLVLQEELEPSKLDWHHFYCACGKTIYVSG